MYAGLQGGRLCFCGNSYGRYGPSAFCHVNCTGNRLTKCGGPESNTVLSTGLG